MAKVDSSPPANCSLCSKEILCFFFEQIDTQNEHFPASFAAGWAMYLSSGHSSVNRGDAGNFQIVLMKGRHSLSSFSLPLPC